MAACGKFEDPVGRRHPTSFNLPPSCTENWRPVPLCRSMQGLQDDLQHTQQQCRTTAVTERLLGAFMLRLTGW